MNNLAPILMIVCFSLFAAGGSATDVIQVTKLIAGDPVSSDFFGSSVSLSGDYLLVGAYRKDNGGTLDVGAAYIFSNRSGSWIQTNKLQASDMQADDSFGFSVSMSGEYAIVGAYGEDAGGSGAGAAYIFRNNSGTWSQTQKVLATDRQADDSFGFSVSMSGEYAIVGAYGEDAGGSGAGAAYIFRNNSGTWSQTQKLIASDAQAGDNFGIRVHIMGDYAIISAYREDTGGDTAGSAYIFKNNAGTWTEVQKIQSTDIEAYDEFGYSVGITADYAIVGAHNEDEDGNNAGAAYVFKRNATDGWEQVQKLMASDSEAGDEFGYHASILGDYIVVTSSGDDDGGANAGAAYVFKRNATDGWELTNKVFSTDIQAGDSYGYSTCLYGNYLAVGARFEDAGGSNAGAAYIFYINSSPVVQDTTPPTLSWNWTDINSTITSNSPLICINASDDVNCTLHLTGTLYTNTTSGMNICWSPELSNGNYTTIYATCDDTSGNKANTTNAWLAVDTSISFVLTKTANTSSTTTGHLINWTIMVNNTGLSSINVTLNDSNGQNFTVTALAAGDNYTISYTTNTSCESINNTVNATVLNHYTSSTDNASFSVNVTHCGDGVCNCNETTTSCVADCPASKNDGSSCNKDWECTFWSDCVAGTQSRDCECDCSHDADCGGNSDEERSCDSSEEDEDDEDGKQTPENTTEDIEDPIIPIVGICQKTWNCTNWSSCEGSMKYRNCTCSCEDNNCLGNSSLNESCIMPPLQELVIERVLRAGRSQIFVRDQFGNIVDAQITVKRTDGTQFTIASGDYLVAEPNEIELIAEKEGYLQAQTTIDPDYRTQKLKATSEGFPTWLIGLVVIAGLFLIFLLWKKKKKEEEDNP